MVSAFLGIPFAEPPVGHLRFEPPQPLRPWRQQRAAVTQPTPCVQNDVEEYSEDCLYLNVYSPQTEGRPLLPVMVYIHGGGYEEGAAEQFTPEYILDEDVVYVAIQYRLSLFGFLSTGDAVVPGNMGLKDVREALRWVRRNVHSFGGDPEIVTIWGEGAGAWTVHLLMTFAADEGLFHAGISQSGTGLSPVAFRPPDEVQKMVSSLARLSGCPSGSMRLVKCLKAKTAQEILQLYNDYKSTFPFELLLNLFPVVGAVIEPDDEDAIVTESPWQRNTSTPWLLGLNNKEFGCFLIPEINDRSEQNFTKLNEVFDSVFLQYVNYVSSDADGAAVPAMLRQFYLHGLPISRHTLSPTVDMLTDATFTYPVYESVLRADKDHTFLYYFTFLGSNVVFDLPLDARVGASHTDQLFFFFPHPRRPAPFPRYNPQREVVLSKELIRMWVHFATYLEPTPSSSCPTQWPPFSDEENFLVIGQERFILERRFLEQRMRFWQHQEYPYRDDNFG